MAKGRGGGGQQNTVMSWSILLAGLALLLLIMLILFGNLSGNVGFGDDSVSLAVLNETPAHANITGYTLAISNSSTSGYVITALWNATNRTGFGNYNNTLVPAANYSVSSTGVLTNATIFFYDNASVSYTLTYSFPSQGKADTDNFIDNYTQSVLNTSKQFPVVGTIIGVALLLAILIGILIFALTKMAGIQGQAGGSRGGNFG